eukprot:1186664-Prorocentrum_minimum.AAC.1
MPSPLLRLVHPAGVYALSPPPIGPPRGGICPLPSYDWSILRGYALSPRPVGPPCGGGYMPSSDGSDGSTLR